MNYYTAYFKSKHTMKTRRAWEVVLEKRRWRTPKTAAGVCPEMNKGGPGPRRPKAGPRSE